MASEFKAENMAALLKLPRHTDYRIVVNQAVYDNLRAIFKLTSDQMDKMVIVEAGYLKETEA